MGDIEREENIIFDSKNYVWLGSDSLEMVLNSQKQSL